MEWLKLIYEHFGASYPRLSLLVVIIIGAALSGTMWWLLGKAYEKSLVVTLPAPPPNTEEPADTALKNTTRSQTESLPLQEKTEPKKRPKPTTESLPPPLRNDMDNYQVPALRELIRQVRAEEMWLSNIFEKSLDSMPLDPVVDYPAALKVLEEKGEVEILETRRQNYMTYSGEVFDENIRFRVKKLSTKVRPKLRPKL